MFKISKHKFNNHIFSIILFEFRFKFSFFFMIIDFSVKPSRDPTSDPPRCSFVWPPEAGYR